MEQQPLNDFDWMQHAKCKGLTDIFYPITDETNGERISREKVAKSICNMCDVVVDCYEHAILNDEIGIWGGKTENERLKESNRRKRLHRYSVFDNY